MKKLLVTILALVMALGVTTMAWADDAKGTAGNPYTLDEFNALTESISGTVYVSLDGKSMDNGLTIGNDAIADHYQYGEWNSETAPEGYPFDTGRIDTRTSDNAKRHIYSTGKETVNVIVVGTVAGAAATGEFTDINKGITLKLPDAAKVTFSGVTFGEGQMRVVVWNEAGVQSMTVPHRMRSITFDGCTFKGNWLQNGAVGVDSMTFTGCTFEKYENTAKPGNSYPIWIQNMGYCNVTFDDCRVNACRPLKLWENDVSGDVTIKDTKFIMSKCTGDDENTHKNVAVMFSTINHALGDIVISDNTVTGDATGFISFYDKDSFAMKEDASFTVTNNQLPAGVETSVKWKEASAYSPDKMVVTPYTPAPRYYYNSTTTDTKTDTTKGSPKTFDAGIGIYAVTVVLSVTGMAWTAKKRH